MNRTAIRQCIAALSCACALLLTLSLSGCAKKYGTSTPKDPDIYGSSSSSPPKGTKTSNDGR